MAGPRYLAVEGPIGVGGTSLARRISERLGGEIVLDPFDRNPFIERFYENPARYALATQLAFLRARWEQQETIPGLLGRTVVTDYLFNRDDLFARITLPEDELALYRYYSAVLGPPRERPDLVVYLQAEPDVLLARITGRGRKYEAGIGEEYLRQVVNSYNHFFFHYKETPLLVVNTAEIDFVHNEKDLDALLAEIDRSRSGTRYYTASSRHPAS